MSVNFSGTTFTCVLRVAEGDTIGSAVGYKRRAASITTEPGKGQTRQKVGTRASCHSEGVCQVTWSHDSRFKSLHYRSLAIRFHPGFQPPAGSQIV